MKRQQFIDNVELIINTEESNVEWFLENLEAAKLNHTSTREIELLIAKTRGKIEAYSTFKLNLPNLEVK